MGARTRTRLGLSVVEIDVDGAGGSWLKDRRGIGAHGARVTRDFNAFACSGQTVAVRENVIGVSVSLVRYS